MKFVVARELGRLAKWLRILGFDTLYFKQDNLSSLILEALRDERIILTRNQRLPRHPGLKIILIKTEKLKEQMREVIKTLNIRIEKDLMFTRCIICNKKLIPIEKKEVRKRIPEYVFSTQEHFLACAACPRIYWQGTHWGNVVNILKEIGC